MLLRPKQGSNAYEFIEGSKGKCTSIDGYNFEESYNAIQEVMNDAQ
jgi:hypothetical protein